jgi:hypothetical protein
MVDAPLRLRNITGNFISLTPFPEAMPFICAFIGVTFFPTRGWQVFEIGRMVSDFYVKGMGEE